MRAPKSLPHNLAWNPATVRAVICRSVNRVHPEPPSEAQKAQTGQMCSLHSLVKVASGRRRQGGLGKGQGTFTS